MALITCSECGNQVSDRASLCPNCGAPVSALSAANEIKCGECGAVIPDGADICPSCGCPAKAESPQPAQPAPPAQLSQPSEPTYSAPSVNPARVQLGSAKAHIREEINRKTKAVNVWLFCAASASIVMFFIAFVKYMKVIGKVDEIAEKHYIAAGVASWLFETVDGILKSVEAAKWCLIIALAAAVLAFIFDLIRMSGKKLMRAWILALPACLFGLLSPIMCGVSNFPRDDSFRMQAEDLADTLDLITNNEHGRYLAVCTVIIIILFFISVFVSLAVPKENVFCQNCGKNIANVLIGDVCPECKERRYVFGFSPVPHYFVKSYQYSGETLTGESSVRTGWIIGVAVIDIIFILLAAFIAFVLREMYVVNNIGFTVLLIVICLLAAVMTAVYMFKRGIRDKITVTPSGVEIQNRMGRSSVQISQITEVLTNESGDLAFCIRGRSFIFTDVSNRAQIAAALRTLVSKR